MKLIIFLSLLLPMTTFAAHLEDVKILSVKEGAENLEVKMQTKGAAKDSFFLMDIMKNDPQAFEKLVMVTKKLSLKDAYRLDLEIPSFSATPSGSYYRSEGIVFTNPQSKESKKPAKKK